jgi:hypothetical protein
MKWIYILTVLVIAAFTLGCVDKNQAGTTTGTTTETTTGTPARVPVSSGESAVTPAGSPSEVSQITPEQGEDFFGTYSDLAAIDNISSDLDMQIALSTDI